MTSARCLGAVSRCGASVRTSPVHEAPAGGNTRRVQTDAGRSTQRPEPPTGGSLTFIGTATGLLRWGPFTLLTDPNFLHRGQAAYLGKGLWSRRLTEPALGPEHLPQ